MLVRSPITKEVIAQFLPSNPRILEAGAHVGRDTVKMSKLWPEGIMYAFEPVPELFAQLQENTKLYKNIECYQLALSDTVGQAVMYVSSGASTAASSLHEPYEYRIKRPEVLFHPLKLQTTTIDLWAKQHNIVHIDFMWLDMQGHELAALEGASSILPTVKCILIEANLSERFKGIPSYHDVYAWMEKHGFKAIQEDLPKHDKINILFVRKTKGT
jgi:FkbM family methyltransferase